MGEIKIQIFLSSQLVRIRWFKASSSEIFLARQRACVADAIEKSKFLNTIHNECNRSRVFCDFPAWFFVQRSMEIASSGSFRLTSWRGSSGFWSRSSQAHSALRDVILNGRQITVQNIWLQFRLIPMWMSLICDYNCSSSQRSSNRTSMTNILNSSLWVWIRIWSLRWRLAVSRGTWIWLIISWHLSQTSVKWTKHWKRSFFTTMKSAE